VFSRIYWYEEPRQAGGGATNFMLLGLVAERMFEVAGAGK